MNNEYLAYAPVSNVQNPTYNLLRSSQKLSSANLDQEVSLYSSNGYNFKERETYENLAEIYSILTTLEYIEKSYLKDNLKHDLYSATVKRLTNQYNSLTGNSEISGHFVSLQHFKKKYKIDCPLSTKRLEAGGPDSVGDGDSALNTAPGTSATQSALGPNRNEAANANAPLRETSTPAVNDQDTSNANANANKTQISSRAVAEATGNFITCMDALKLNYKAKDQLYPLLSDLVTSINIIHNDDDDDDDDEEEEEEENDDSDNEEDGGSGKIQNAKHKLDFEGRGKLVEWLIKLNHMKVDDELTEDQVRQLLFDLDTAYKHFYTSLE